MLQFLRINFISLYVLTATDKPWLFPRAPRGYRKARVHTHSGFGHSGREHADLHRRANSAFPPPDRSLISITASGIPNVFDLTRV